MIFFKKDFDSIHSNIALLSLEIAELKKIRHAHIDTLDGLNRRVDFCCGLLKGILDVLNLDYKNEFVDDPRYSPVEQPQIKILKVYKKK